MERLERLVNLVAALIDTERPLTRRELRARVGGYAEDDEAFRRNFERDKDILRQMGLPLVTVTPDGGEGGDDRTGYRIPRERYELPDPGLSEEELAALRIAAGAVRVGEGPEGGAVTTALAKLGAPQPGGDDPLAELAELAGGEAVAVAFGAIAERRALRFRYRGEPRRLEPWRLAYRAGRWYLSGRDSDRDAERQFRLDRVEGSLAPSGPPGAFEPPAGPQAAPRPPWQLADGPTRAVTVAVDPDQAAWAVASAGPDTTVLQREDGGAVLTLQVSNDAAFRSWLLGFLDHAEVLAPGDVRADVVAWLGALAS